MTDFSDDRFGSPIRQLDRSLVNKIAAGEVVERPASVIKEMVENSLDAGADTIEIIARKAGTTFISVTDNGTGIKSDQIDLAFSRHATSKINSVDDLFAVNSFGFRGEALPSIASVSHLSLTTRHFSEEAGTQIIYEGGQEIQRRPVSAPVGTKIEISHLFFNTPARRKFLKAETTESRQIVRAAERMALGKPSAAISLNLNDRQIFRLPHNQPVAERMASLFGLKTDGVVEYDVELSDVSYLVYLAHPDLARHDRTRICLFINGRSVSSSSIIHAVTAGYGEFLPGGRFPLAVLFLTIDSSNLDVNVHPTKAEVRLSNERAVHDNLYRIVKKALRDWRMVPSDSSSQFGSRSGMDGGGRYRPHSGGNFNQSGNLSQTADIFSHAPLSINKPVAPSGASPSLPDNQFSSSGGGGCDNSRPVVDSITSSDQYQPPPKSDLPKREDVEYLGKSGRTYLIITIRGALYVVDQHAAHERVLYESALEEVEKGSGLSQKTLFPETIELSAEEFITFENSRAVLDKLGFEVEPFGQRSVIVNGMPPVFRDNSPVRIMRRLLDDIGALDKAGGDLIKSVAQSMACRAAVMAGDRLGPEEVKGLVADLFATNNPFCCPHGRPTFIKIGLEELDSRFGRT